MWLLRQNYLLTRVMSELRNPSIVAHDIYMRRTWMNPISDLCTLLSLWQLMRKIQTYYILGYTITPVI